jgi:hypothetical protein
MTVRELIDELLGYPMGSKVEVHVNDDKVDVPDLSIDSVDSVYSATHVCINLTIDDNQGGPN